MIFDRALTDREIYGIYQEGLNRQTVAIASINAAIEAKFALLKKIQEACEKELTACTSLDELLQTGDFRNLKRGDVTATQKIHSAIQHQEQAVNDLQKSIEKTPRCPCSSWTVGTVGTARFVSV